MLTIAIDEAIASFYTQLEKRSIPADLRPQLTTDFEHLIEQLKDIPLTSLDVSVLQETGTHFRFSPEGSDIEFSLTIWYDYDPDDEADIQATLHQYVNGKLADPYYIGTTDEMIAVVKSTIEHNGS